MDKLFSKKSSNMLDNGKDVSDFASYSDEESRQTHDPEKTNLHLYPRCNHHSQGVSRRSRINYFALLGLLILSLGALIIYRHVPTSPTFHPAQSTAQAADVAVILPANHNITESNEMYNTQATWTVTAYADSSCTPPQIVQATGGGASACIKARMGQLQISIGSAVFTSTQPNTFLLCPYRTWDCMASESPQSMTAGAACKNLFPLDIGSLKVIPAADQGCPTHD